MVHPSLTVKWAGYEEIVFCPEPIAAGLDFIARDAEKKLILITDFGGATSREEAGRRRTGLFNRRHKSANFSAKKSSTNTVSIKVS